MNSVVVINVRIFIFIILLFCFFLFYNNLGFNFIRDEKFFVFKFNGMNFILMILN